MELTVRPDDLAACATALRQAHAALARARADLGATALRLVPRLGPHAADTAQSTLLAADHGAGLVEDDLAAFSQGLTAVATCYAALDAHALGSITVRLDRH